MVWDMCMLVLYSVARHDLCLLVHTPHRHMFLSQIRLHVFTH